MLSSNHLMHGGIRMNCSSTGCREGWCSNIEPGCRAVATDNALPQGITYSDPKSLSEVSGNCFNYHFQDSGGPHCAPLHGDRGVDDVAVELARSVPRGPAVPRRSGAAVCGRGGIGGGGG